MNEYYCTVCGTSVSEDNLFCPNCGDSFEENHTNKCSELDSETSCPKCKATIKINDIYCSKCGNLTKDSDQINYFKIKRMEQKISYLEHEIDLLESKIPRSLILSQGILSRALAVYGLSLLGGLIISLPIYFIIILISFVVSS